MLDRVVWPLLATAGVHAGRAVRPCLNRLVDCTEWVAGRFR